MNILDFHLSNGDAIDDGFISSFTKITGHVIISLGTIVLFSEPQDCINPKILWNKSRIILQEIKTKLQLENFY